MLVGLPQMAPSAEYELLAAARPARMSETSATVPKAAPPPHLP